VHWSRPYITPYIAWSLSDTSVIGPLFWSATALIVRVAVDQNKMVQMRSRTCDDRGTLRVRNQTGVALQANWINYHGLFMPAPRLLARHLITIPLIVKAACRTARVLRSDQARAALDGVHFLGECGATNYALHNWRVVQCLASMIRLCRKMMVSGPAWCWCCSMGPLAGLRQDCVT
jgi:hypothetical protein